MARITSGIPNRNYQELKPEQIELVDTFLQELTKARKTEERTLGTIEHKTIRDAAASPEGIRVLGERAQIRLHLDKAAERTGKRPKMPKMDSSLPRNEALAVRHSIALAYALRTLGDDPTLLKEIEDNAQTQNGNAVLVRLEEIERHRNSPARNPHRIVEPFDFTPSQFNTHLNRIRQKAEAASKAREV